MVTCPSAVFGHMSKTSIWLQVQVKSLVTSPSIRSYIQVQVFGHNSKSLVPTPSQVFDPISKSIFGEMFKSRFWSHFQAQVSDPKSKALVIRPSFWSHNSKSKYPVINSGPSLGSQLQVKFGHNFQSLVTTSNPAVSGHMSKWSLWPHVQVKSLVTSHSQVSWS